MARANHLLCAARLVQVICLAFLPMLIRAIRQAPCSTSPASCALRHYALFIRHYYRIALMMHNVSMNAVHIIYQLFSNNVAAAACIYCTRFHNHKMIAIAQRQVDVVHAHPRLSPQVFFISHATGCAIRGSSFLQEQHVHSFFNESGNNHTAACVFCSCQVSFKRVVALVSRAHNIGITCGCGEIGRRVRFRSV